MPIFSSRLDREPYRAEIQRWGVARFLFAAVMRRLHRRLFICGVWVRPLSPKTPDAAQRYSVRQPTRDELNRALADSELSLDRAFIDAALERGDICSSAFDGDRLIAYGWRTLATAPHLDGLWVRCSKPYCYGYNAFTHPDYRGKHLSTGMTRMLDVYAAEQGFTHHIAFMSPDNYASVASMRHRDGRRIGWAGYFKLFGKVYPFHSPGTRKHTFRFYVEP